MNRQLKIPHYLFVKKIIWIYFLDRSTYRNNKFNNPIFNTIIKSEENIFVIPEGGFNEFGIKGCEEIMNEVNEHYDIICCSIGSGCTAVGVIKSLKFDQFFLGFSSFKNNSQIKNIISEKVKKRNWEINSEYNFGGFGVVNEELKNLLEHLRIDMQLCWIQFTLQNYFLVYST